MGAGLRILYAELFKIYSKPRTFIAYGAIFILVGSIQLGIKLDGQKILGFMTQNLQESFDFTGNLLNGYLITFVILNTLLIQLPFLVSLVAADVIAGDASAGVFRLILTRPVSRIKVLSAKFVAVLIYSSSLIVLLGITGLFFSMYVFGKGDLLVIRKVVNIFTDPDIMWRFYAAFAYGILGMGVVASLAFFISSFADNSLGPIVMTMAVIIVFTVFSSLNFSIFNVMRPFLFTTYLNEWRDFFDYELDKPQIMKSTLILLGHIVLLFALTVINFNKKDILS